MSHRPRIRSAAVVAALVVLLGMVGATPSIAGTLYAVLSLSQTVAGTDTIDLRSEIVVSNPTSDAVQVSMYYIGTGMDGVERGENFAPPEFTVGAGQTRVFGQSVLGPRGIVEIQAPATVGVSARLVSETSNGTINSTETPVVGSEELTRGGQFFAIHGLRRDMDVRSSLGIANLSNTVNNCLVQLVNPNGSAVIGLVSLPVQPRSSVYFEDALSAAGATTGEEIRVQAVCANDAFAHSVVLDTATGQLNTLRPAADGSSSLSAPGTGLQCETGNTCFSFPGTFFVPSPSRPHTQFDLTGVSPSTRFQSVRVQMTVFHNGWSNSNSGGYHGFFWLYRNSQWRQTFGYLNARGPNRFRLINETLVGVPSGVDRTTADVVLQPGETYVVDYIYNAATGAVRTTLLDTSGNVIATMIDAARVSSFEFGNLFSFYVGLEDIGFVETTTYGWRYMDALISFTPVN